MSAASRPLDGITVLELGHIVAGPFCSMLLADLGADVIKVENPATGGDMVRDSSELGNSVFNFLNRNKRSITIDLKDDEGREVFHELVDDADVIVENFGPGAAERLGIGYDELSERNPGLIYCSIKGFNPGPYERYAALDPIAEAMSGLMSVTGREDMPPVRVGTSIADMAAAMFGVISVLGALQQRARTGVGQKIHSSLFESSVYLMGYWFPYVDAYGKIPKPLGASHLNWSPYEVFRTTDEEWVFIGPSGQHQWEKLCEEFDLDRLLDDDRFATLDQRRQHDDELIAILREEFRAFGSEELIDRLREQNVPVAPINDVGEVLEDEHLRATGAFDRVGTTEGRGNTVRVPRYPVIASGAEPPGSRDAPTLGEDTDAILAELGYGSDEIDALHESDAV